MERDTKTKPLIEEGVKKNDNLKDKIWEEAKKIWVVAGPAIFNRLSTYGVNIISQAFIGHVGSIELAAYSLVFTVLIRLIIGIMMGMASGLETLCGQAYGAKQYHMLGIYLQRSWIVLFVTSCLLVPLFILITPILKALGQDEAIAEMAATVGLWAIPAMFSYFIAFSSQTFLQAQSRNIIIAYLAALSLAIHIPLSWLLTVKYKYGIPGAMISTILAFWIPNIGQILFITCGGCPDTWTGFSFLAFKDLWPMIKLSASSGVMLCLEIWYPSILVLMTGNFINAEVAIDALSICININGWGLMIAFGFLAASSVRVANELGRGEPDSAKFSIVMTVLNSFAIGFMLFVFFLLYRGRVAYVFTESCEVASAIAHLSPLLAFSILLNSVQPVLSGVAVGSGWQVIVAYVNIGSYYLVGIPIGFILGFVFKLQVEGVWTGMLIGVLVQSIILVIITCKTDWDKEVSNAKNRLSRWYIEDELLT